MKTILKDDYCDVLRANKELIKYDVIYNYYKKACDDLNLLINGNLNLNDYWDIIDRYYDVELFESEHDTIMTCKKLGIKYKRLNTDFILYKKDKHAPKFYFEDWIIMETGKVDARRIYSEQEIKDLLDANQMVVLYPYATRPASKRLNSVNNGLGGYDLTYNGEFVIDESELNNTYGQLEDVTYYSNWMDIYFNIYNNPDIQNKIREKVFTKEKIGKDIAYYKFRALEILKFVRDYSLNNNLNIESVIEEERNSLVLRRD